MLIISFIAVVRRSAKIETLSKLFDFYIIWKPLMTGFQIGLFFKFGQVVTKIFES